MSVPTGVVFMCTPVYGILKFMWWAQFLGVQTFFVCTFYTIFVPLRKVTLSLLKYDAESSKNQNQIDSKIIASLSVVSDLHLYIDICIC